MQAQAAPSSYSTVWSCSCIDWVMLLHRRATLQPDAGLVGTERTCGGRFQARLPVGLLTAERRTCLNPQRRTSGSRRRSDRVRFVGHSSIWAGCAAHVRSTDAGSLFDLSEGVLLQQNHVAALLHLWISHKDCGMLVASSPTTVLPKSCLNECGSQQPCRSSGRFELG